MGNWGSFYLAVTASVLAALPLHTAAAGEFPDKPALLQLDAPVLAREELAAENLHGLGLPAPDLFSGPVDMSVVLWDELKPGHPAPPSQQPASIGQGRTVVNGSVR